MKFLGTISSAGVGPLHFIGSNLSPDAEQEVFEQFTVDQICGNDSSIFQQILATALTVKETSSWFPVYGITVTVWLGNSFDLNSAEDCEELIGLADLFITLCMNH